MRRLSRSAGHGGLAQWVEHALQDTRQMVLVTGEVGLGKPILVEAFLQALEGRDMMERRFTISFNT
jgi:hypothetical protein